MKKIYALLAVLYTNTVLLGIFCLYLSGVFFAIISEFVFKVEPVIDENSFDQLAGFYTILPLLFLIWFGVYGVLFIINIISVIKNYKNNDAQLLFTKMKTVKIKLIPFWILNFIFYVPISVVLLLVGHGFGFIIVPLFIGASYNVLLLTSSFSIAYLLNLKKNNLLEKKQFVIHVILQLLFVVDIIDTIRLIKLTDFNAPVWLQYPRRTIIIDGNNFSDLEGFFDEVDRKLTKVDYKTGHNMNAFNDILRGGFGVHEYGEPLLIKWVNFSKSYRELGSELMDDIVAMIKNNDYGHDCILETDSE